MKPSRFLAAAGLALTAFATALSAAPADWVGKPLPDLGVKFLDAAPDLKGKPAIVEFWATWCPPCLISIPHLNKINEKYSKRGLEIVGITGADDQKTVEKFRTKVPMNYNVALDDDGKLTIKLGVDTIPQAFVVNKAGKIVWEGRPMELSDSIIEKVLK